jgi:hypothetical protein
MLALACPAVGVCREIMSLVGDIPSSTITAVLGASQRLISGS